MRRFFAIIGLLGGLMWITIRFFPPECTRITGASEVLCNRLWSPALLGMVLGFTGLFLTIHPSLTQLAWGSFIALPIGFALMFLGNFVEYWTLYDWPHQGPDGWARSMAWMTVLLGFLVVMVASTLAGLLGFKLRCIPRWLSLLLVLLFPSTFIIGFVNINLAGLPIGVVNIAVGFSCLLHNGHRTSLVRSA